jgi:P pilus assembly chaperone PapD
MVKVAARQGDVERVKLDARMIGPGETARLPLKGKPGNAALELSFTSINDFGGQVPYQAILKKNAATSASRAGRR